MILRWFKSPGSQRNPHHWAATYAGHWVIVSGIWVCAWQVTGPYQAALVASVVYALWEVFQLIFAPRPSWALAADGLLDWCAGLAGVLTLAAVAEGDQLRALAMVAVAGATVAVGIWKRSGT